MSATLCWSKRARRRGSQAAGEPPGALIPSPAARFSPQANRTLKSYVGNERGQALVETALFFVLAVLLAFGLLAWIPIHRAVSITTAAAYACAQFLAESSDPCWAAWGA